MMTVCDVAKLLVFILFLASCATRTAPPVTELPAAVPAVTVPPVTVLAGDPCSGPEGLLGNTEASVVRRFGAPREREVARLPNRHNPSIMDERITLRYDGAVVVLHTVPKYRLSFLARLEVTDPAFDVMPGLRVGMTREAAAAALALPAAKGTAVKDCPLELPPTIEAVFDAQRLVRVVWINEPD